MSESLTDNGFPPLSSFRLIVPPLQLVSAALLEMVKQGVVMSSCGVLEEFITTVLETAPELLTDTDRDQLVIGLRAKVVLELCRGDPFPDQQALQHHLNEMNTYITNQETSNSEVKASVVNFLKLVHTFTEDQCQKDDFYQNIFPTVFGPKYDSALQALMKKFLFNLQELLPVPSLEQTSLWLSLSPTILKDCLDLMNQPQPLKTLIQHHKHHGHKVPSGFSSSGDDCILSSLSIHLPNVDNKCYVQVKSEPMCDSQDWQRDDFLDRELKEDKEEDLKPLYPELVRNMEEPGQQCVSEVTEDQGASVEVILPSFDETESSDDDYMDKNMSHYLKSGRKTSVKSLKYERSEDISCRSKCKEHNISHSALLPEPTDQFGSTNHTGSFEKKNVHHLKSTKTKSRTKELPEDLRLRIVDLHKAGKGYKSISKSLDVHRSTVRKIVCKWRKFSTVATLPRSGRPLKMTARAQHRILNEVKKNPGVSAKDLHKALAHANISVSESTIRKTLKKNGVHGWTSRRKPPLSSMEK